MINLPLYLKSPKRANNNPAITAPKPAADISMPKPLTPTFNMSLAKIGISITYEVPNKLVIPTMIINIKTTWLFFIKRKPSNKSFMIKFLLLFKGRFSVFIHSSAIIIKRKLKPLI